jgi:hypothetical protein
MMLVSMLVGLLVFAKGISILLVFIHFDILDSNVDETLEIIFDLSRLIFNVLESGPAIIIIFVYYKAYSKIKSLQDELESIGYERNTTISEYKLTTLNYNSTVSG